MDFHFKPNGSTDLNPTSKPRARYRKILETLIRDWRDKSGSEIPFIICQLPNFGPKLPEPVESAWAEIRQAQLDALRLTKTAIVVLIDCGDADVHPPNKKPVGERAAALALRGFHGRNPRWSLSRLPSVTPGPTIPRAISADHPACLLHLSRLDDTSGEADRFSIFLASSESRCFATA